MFEKNIYILVFGDKHTKYNGINIRNICEYMKIIPVLYLINLQNSGGYYVSSVRSAQNEH